MFAIRFRDVQSGRPAFIITMRYAGNTTRRLAVYNSLLCRWKCMTCILFINSNCEMVLIFMFFSVSRDEFFVFLILSLYRYFFSSFTYLNVTVRICLNVFQLIDETTNARTWGTKLFILFRVKRFTANSCPANCRFTFGPCIRGIIIPFGSMCAGIIKNKHLGLVLPGRLKFS